MNQQQHSNAAAPLPAAATQPGTDRLMQVQLDLTNQRNLNAQASLPNFSFAPPMINAALAVSLQQ